MNHFDQVQNSGQLVQSFCGFLKNKIYVDRYANYFISIFKIDFNNLVHVLKKNYLNINIFKQRRRGVEMFCMHIFLSRTNFYLIDAICIGETQMFKTIQKLSSKSVLKFSKFQQLVVGGLIDFYDRDYIDFLTRKVMNICTLKDLKC